jgi:phenylacetate-CoA ligase
MSLSNPILARIYGWVPPSLRYGKVYRRTRAEIASHEPLTERRIEDVQIELLRRLLSHCLENVPFHAERIRSSGLDPMELRSVSQLRHLPLLDKSDIRAAGAGILARNFPSSETIEVTTGGSTGSPLRFVQQRGYSWERELAFISRMWERVGFRFGKDARLVLRGKTIQGGIRFDPKTKEYLCSTYETDASSLRRYLELLRSERIRFIHGHVSSIALFAQYLVSKGECVPLKAVLGGSEKPYPFQEELVRKAFGCKLFSWYGQSEQVVLAGECEGSELYHAFPEYGIVEIIDESGMPIDRPGMIGEIVGTGFNNFLMPFLRYRTGDRASFAAGTCGHCGRPYRLLNRIEGRDYEYVMNRDGNLISLTGLVFGQHFRSFGAILKMQVSQEIPGEIEIKIVPGLDFDEEAVVSELVGKIESASHSKVAATVKVVERIEPTAAGKHRFLIQKLTIPGIAVSNAAG